MNYLRRFYCKFINLFKNSTTDKEMDREINSHLTLLEDDFLRKGMSPQEARQAARHAYGDVE